MVWNVTNEQGQNVSGYYARLPDLLNGEWSEPMELDENRGLGIAIPSVYEYKDQVFILYNNGLDNLTAPVHWMRRSEDGGLTFTRHVRPFNNHIGRNGQFWFVVDSSDTLASVFWSTYSRWVSMASWTCMACGMQPGVVGNGKAH